MGNIKKYNRSPSFRFGNKKIHPSNVRDVGNCSCECYNAQQVYAGDPWYGGSPGMFTNMTGQPLNAPATCFCNNHCGQGHDGRFCGSLWDYNQDGIYTWQPPTGFNPASHMDGPCYDQVNMSGQGTGDGWEHHDPGWELPEDPTQPRDITTPDKRRGGRIMRAGGFQKKQGYNNLFDSPYGPGDYNPSNPFDPNSNCIYGHWSVGDDVCPPNGVGCCGNEMGPSPLCHCLSGEGAYDSSEIGDGWNDGNPGNPYGCDPDYPNASWCDSDSCCTSETLTDTESCCCLPRYDNPPYYGCCVPLEWGQSCPSGNCCIACGIEEEPYNWTVEQPWLIVYNLNLAQCWDRNGIWATCTLTPWAEECVEEWDGDVPQPYGCCADPSICRYNDRPDDYCNNTGQHFQAENGETVLPCECYAAPRTIPSPIKRKGGGIMSKKNNCPHGITDVDEWGNNIC